MRRFAFFALVVPCALLGRAHRLASASGPVEHADSMRVDMVVPPKAAAGESVPITLRIANTGDRPIELHLQGRTITFDVIVRRGDAVVWRRLEGATVPAILQIRTLAPGEVIELKDVWRQTDATGKQVTPGDYTVSGSVPTDGKPLRTAPVALRITAAGLPGS